MIDQHKLTRDQDIPREQEFTRRYAQLLAWALRLTNNHRATAEDLVQDAFIQFTRSRTNLDEIENLDGYLHRMLRNMHISRLGRTAQQLQTNLFSITELGCQLDAPGSELQERLQAHEELCRICQYACTRKESSRAGSVLILRFFHDYTPSEIAEVLCTSRHCVDQWQRFARRELKLYLSTPQRLRFVTTTKSITLPQMRAFSSRSLADDLRVLIFSSRQGPCLSAEELKQIYEGKTGELLSTTKVGHIVSCRSCLDQVNSILGLPPLDQRFQGTNGSSQLPPMAGGGCGGGSDEGPTRLNSKLQRHLADVINHEPKELHIAVNGLRIGSLKVGLYNSALALNLIANEPAEFIEIVSEEGMQLLFFNLNQDVYDFDEQWAQIELSDGRFLETWFYIEGDSPMLRVSYDTVPVRKALAVTTIRTCEGLSNDESESPVAEPQTVEQISSIHRFARRTLAAILRALLIGSRNVWRSRLWLNPQVVTLLIASVLITGLILIWLRTDASTVLNKAVVAEEYSNKSTGVLHRVLRLEQRRVGEGSTSVQTIKIWQDSGYDRIARRVYDERNLLIAGEWRTRNAARVIYHHQLGLKNAPESNEDYAAALLEPWRLEVTAKAFRSLVGMSNLEIGETPGEYIITWNGSRRMGAATLLSATLTITKHDLVIVQESLEIEKSEERYQYRFVELHSERLKDQQSSPEYFRPDAFLIEGVRTREKSTGEKDRNSSTDRAKPVGNKASTELEIEVTYLLSRAKADKNEQIALTRTSAGSLLIEGVVETDQRKREIEAALDPVRKNPLVSVHLQAASDVSRRLRQSPDGITEAMRNTPNTISVDRELRNYLRASSPSSVNNMDDAVQQFSARVVRASYRALFHAAELKCLSNRFSSDDLRTVGPDARSKWIQMVHENARAFEFETAILRRSLGPLFFSPGATTPPPNVGPISNNEALAKRVERLWKLALTNNRIVRDAFTISSENSDVAVKSTSFWQSLINSQALAAEIERYGY
jgi:RNA polymerase sigma factor (sigma-70 family)